jgi:hypothetical protein
MLKFMLPQQQQLQHQLPELAGTLSKVQLPIRKGQAYMLAHSKGLWSMSRLHLSTLSLMLSISLIKHCYLPLHTHLFTEFQKQLPQNCDTPQVMSLKRYPNTIPLSQSCKEILLRQQLHSLMQSAIISTT